MVVFDLLFLIISRGILLLLTHLLGRQTFDAQEWQVKSATP